MSESLNFAVVGRLKLLSFSRSEKVGPIRFKSTSRRSYVLTVNNCRCHVDWIRHLSFDLRRFTNPRHEFHLRSIVRQLWQVGHVSCQGYYLEKVRVRYSQSIVSRSEGTQKLMNQELFSSIGRTIDQWDVITMSMHFGGSSGGAGTLESPRNLKRAVGRTSFGAFKFIPLFWKLTSSILKPHWILPSTWCSVIAELYRFFSKPPSSSFVFITLPVITAWGCGATVKLTAIPRVRPDFVDDNCFSSPSESEVVVGLMHVMRAFSWCESTSTLRWNCLYALSVGGIVPHVSLWIEENVPETGVDSEPVASSRGGI